MGLIGHDNIQSRDDNIPILNVFPPRTLNTQNDDPRQNYSPPPLQRPKTLFTRSRISRTKQKTASKKKKTAKKNQACLYCGRTETPEWRKGPCGGLSLCNACGLNYAKNLKREKLIEPAPQRNVSLSLILNEDSKD